MANEALIRAREIAAELIDKSPASLAAVKQFVRGAGSRDVNAGLKVEQQAFAEILRDEDAMATMRAFCQNEDQDITR